MIHPLLVTSCCEQSSAATSIPEPARPFVRCAPGAVRVGGIDGEDETNNEYTETETTAENDSTDPNDPVSAEVVDEDEENRKFQEQVAREVAAQRERERAEQEETFRS